MGNQGQSVIELKKQVFRPPSQRNNFAAHKALGKLLRYWKAQIRPPLFDLGYACAFDDGKQPPTYSFDFWQFRHVC